jgi:predicted  nucleic acid-binding Zn-ribbon protein
MGSVKIKIWEVENLQGELSTLRNRLEDLKREITRLNGNDVANSGRIRALEKNHFEMNRKLDELAEDEFVGFKEL